MERIRSAIVCSLEYRFGRREAKCGPQLGAAAYQVAAYYRRFSLNDTTLRGRNPMSGEPIIHQVLAHYASRCQPNRIEALRQAGGFSGAEFWRLQTESGTLCLRRWPREHPPAGQLQFIHDVLRHVSERGFSLVPVPFATRRSEPPTFVACQGHLWELTPWLPGNAGYHDQPNRAKLLASMKTLAHFHLAASDFPVAERQRQPSPGIMRRQETLRRWQSNDITRLAASLNAIDDSSLRPIAADILRHFERTASSLSLQLLQATTISVRLQPVIRDVWDQHILFEGDAVSGLIDFGAMRIDNVSTDIARLLGSLARDNEDDWQAGLDAYQQLRPLSSDEKQLIGTFDLSIVLLSGLNWLRWLYLENRVFPDKDAVFFRLQAILERLRCVAI